MPEQKLSEKDKQALKAAEDFLIDQYTMLTRSDIEKNWDLDEEDFAKLEFNGDGLLAAGIAESHIVDYDPPPNEVWRIEVTADIGIEVDPEEWDVYQADNGEWIVEHL